MRKVPLVVLIALLVGCNFPNPGKGEKVGTIIKLSHEGIMCTTGEGQLIRGGMANGSGSFGVTPFDFTVSDELWPKAESAFNAQRPVRIHYEAHWGWGCSSETGYFLTALEYERPDSGKP